VRNQEPKSEVQIYTWADATLRELTDLVKEVFACVTVSVDTIVSKVLLCSAFHSVCVRHLLCMHVVLPW